jgi:hypothetical protein
MKPKILFLIFLFIHFGLKAQNITISGLIRDSLSQENLVGAVIVEKSKNIFTTCNEYGFYSIKLPKGENNIQILLLGYSKKSITINVQTDTTLNINLIPTDINLQQITVKANVPQMNWYSLPMAKINKMPVIAGETDVLKALQLTPGITSGNEGSAGLNVRGGSPDQNLFLLDGIPVYNVNHVMGYLSVFNTDALKSVNLIKGGIPAEYHGRASAVVDIYMKEGDLNKVHGSITLGLIASKLMLEGPIVKDKSSFLFTARRSYMDILFRPFSNSFTDGIKTGYYFYDFNFKWNYKFSDRNRLYLSLYTGKDKGYMENDEKNIVHPDILKLKIKQDIDWGNITGALRWFKILGTKLSVNNTLYYAKYKYKASNDYFIQELSEGDTLTKQYNLYNGSGIEDIGYKLSFDYFPARNNKLKFGLSVSYKKFFPGFVSEQYFDNSSLQDTLRKDKQTNSNKIIAYEYSFFGQDNLTIGKFNAVFGINANGFLVNSKIYFFTEPRINLIYNINNKINIQASYSQTHQYIHLLTNSGLGLPTDLWVPATDSLKPIAAGIYDIGSKIILTKSINIGISVYYKTLNNLIKYKQGTDFMDVKTDWKNKVTTGKGRAYGIEFYIQKNTGKIGAQIAYTYSRSFRTFEYINNGNEFPYVYDRPHNLNILAEYHLNKKIMFTTNWILMSGQNMTYGYQQFLINNMGENNESFVLPYISEYNNIRLPIYHRLDIAFNYTNIRKKTTRIWYLGVYNVYNRLNPYYMTPSPYPNTLTGMSFAPVMPFISYTLKF